MKECCANEEQIHQLKKSHGRVLWIVLAINLSMFFLELLIGLFCQSTSLMADSLDMLGDALVYGFSILVLGKGLKLETYAATAKGLIMLLFGIGVFAETIFKMTQTFLPEAKIMGFTAVCALVMNLICFAMLWNHRSDNLNMKSTWVCSRNDLIGNVGVIAASFLTSATLSKWPDLIVGLALSVLFIRSAFSVLRDAKNGLSEGSCANQTALDSSKTLN